MNNFPLLSTLQLPYEAKPFFLFKFISFFFLAFFLSNAPIQAQWVIDGQSTNEGFGSQSRMSDDGSIVAVAGPRYDSFRGVVRVYKLQQGAWIQQGTDIKGDTISDSFGSAISFSADGTILAASAPGNDFAGTNFGQVKVMQWQSGAWTQIGNDIYGTAAHDGFGSAVGLSEDGMTLAIGARLDDAVASNAGSVKIYEYNAGTWVQKGQDLEGTGIDDYLGAAISMSNDGNRIAIGAFGSNNTSGHVEVHEWQSNAWVQLGTDIIGEGVGDNSGTAVSLSGDGMTLGIGALNNDNPSGMAAGHARIFGWQSGTWAQIGMDLDGEAAYDRNGSSIQLSEDGTQVAVGSPRNSSITFRCGQVRLFTLNSGTWVQNGPDINGVGAAFAGQAISLSSDFSYLTVNGNQGFGYVTIHNFDACEMTGVEAIPTTSTSAILLWETKDDAERYRVRYKEQGGSWEPVMLLGSHPLNYHALNGLQPNMDYIL